jgi:hypothetical protein
LTLAELASRHGIHQTMIAAWKKRAVDGMAAMFSGNAEAVQATRAAISIASDVAGAAGATRHRSQPVKAEIKGGC